MSHHTSKLNAAKIARRMKVYIGTDNERHPEKFKCVQDIDIVDDNVVVYFFSGEVRAYPRSSDVLVTRQSIAYARG